VVLLILVDKTYKYKMNLQPKQFQLCISAIILSVVPHMSYMLTSWIRSTLLIILRIWTRLDLIPKASPVTLVIFLVDVSSKHYPLTKVRPIIGFITNVIELHIEYTLPHKYGRWTSLLALEPRFSYEKTIIGLIQEKTRIHSKNCHKSSL
jgi:hypothetical protein